MIEILENCELMPEKEWIKYIEELEKKSEKSTKEEVKKALIEAVKKRIPKQKFGILFSGGVDSTTIAFLCKQNKADFICYSAGMENSPDIMISRKATEKLGLKIKQKILTIEEADKLFERTAKIFEQPDVLSVGVGAVIIAGAELALKDGIKILFGGLGSEEIFAGYQRHLEAEDPHAECWKGLKGMWRRDFARDFAIAKKLGIKAKMPFLDEELIRKAMGITADRKINKEHKKIILREIAEELGVPKEFSWRDKKAAQYGSYLDKAMQKLAKQKGYQTKQRYIESFIKT